MNQKIAGVIAGVIMGIASAAVLLSVTSDLPDSETFNITKNEKIGLVINTSNQSVSLQRVDEVFSDAASSGIGRNNVYLFWNLVEPQKGEFDWRQSDVLMGLNEKNDLKVTLFFSVINGETLGPFPDWIGRPSLNSIDQQRLVSVLDAILSRYHIIDTVIIAGETESQFRYHEQNIPVYKELFSGVYEKIKEKHPDVKLGNSFALHHVLNKELTHIVDDLIIGDFVAFSYFPVDNLNDIVNTPQESREDLQRAFEIVPNKKVGFFEVSWSTSDFIGGSTDSQKDFLMELFEFYSENESEIEFLTWYRQYDRPEGTCATEQQDIGDKKISVGGSSGLGGSEYVIERLNYYVCNAGLVDVNDVPKSGWNEFKKQIELIN